MARKRPTQREAIISSAMKPQGGLGQMLAEQGADKDLVAAAEQVESMPGGMDLLYTVAAEEMMKKQGVSKKDAKKIRLYKMGGPVPYRKGGSTKSAAEQTRRAGRGDDSMMLHVSPEEYEVIESMWGPAETNPDTGIGEYGFLSKIWKKVKKGVKKIVKSKIFQVVAPIALSIFVPGLGAAIGGALAGGASAGAQAIIGNAVVQGGLGAVSGGKEGALRGAAMGAVSGGLGKMAGSQVSKVAPGLSERTANVIGTGLASGTASSLTGGDFTSGAIMGGLGEYMGTTTEGLAEKGRGMLGLAEPKPGEMFAKRPGLGEGPGHATPEMMAAADATMAGGPPQPRGAPGEPMTAARETGPLGGLGMDDLVKYGLPLMALSGAGGGGDEPGPPGTPEGFGDSLPVYAMNRQFSGLPDPGSYYTYGQPGSPQSGQHLFMQPEPFSGETGTPLTPPGQGQPPGGLGQAAPPPEGPAPGGGRDRNQPLFDQYGNRVAARGGYQRGGAFDFWSQNEDVPTTIPTVSASGRYVKGAGTGRSDDIEARLSDGEYVMDAETVALLGDGSGDAGARRLDEMRTNLRKHKGENLKKGSFSKKAKAPHSYMSRGGMARLRAATAGRA